MPSEVLKQLLECGVHFGHQTRRWNPKMKRFIFGERSGIYIIDLEKTEEYLKTAKEAAQAIAAQGGRILFIGTKKQAQDVIETEAKRCDMPYINSRWMGGLLTNFTTVRKSIDKLFKIEKMEEEGILENLTKKEAAVLKLLCMHAEQVLPRELVLNMVWGDDSYFLGRSLDVFISRLRKYLKRDERVRIMNVHGVGFKLQVE